MLAVTPIPKSRMRRIASVRRAALEDRAGVSSFVTAAGRVSASKTFTWPPSSGAGLSAAPSAPCRRTGGGISQEEAPPAGSGGDDVVDWRSIFPAGGLCTGGGSRHDDPSLG